MPRETSARRPIRKGKKKTFRKLPKRTLPTVLDISDTELLSKFVTEKGKILPRRITRLSAKDQRQITRVIKKSRFAGLLPFVIN